MVVRLPGVLCMVTHLGAIRLPGVLHRPEVLRRQGIRCLVGLRAAYRFPGSRFREDLRWAARCVADAIRMSSKCSSSFRSAEGGRIPARLSGRRVGQHRLPWLPGRGKSYLPV